MKSTDIQRLMASFESAANCYKNDKNESVEYWLARDLQKIFRYADSRNFGSVISKAIDACKNAGGNIDDHFLFVKSEIKAGVAVNMPSQRNISKIMTLSEKRF